MKKQNELLVLTNFFRNLKLNEETSRTEVQIFLQTYLEYIFKLNKIDINNYIITVNQVQLSEYHAKREKKFKNEPNHEKRMVEKRKTLTKPSYKPDNGDHYFDALMRPDAYIENKFAILLNRDLCHAKNHNEIDALIYLFHCFGHEVHHIIQEIKYKKESQDYTESILLHEDYLEFYKHTNQTSPREAKKIRRAINQHLDLLFFCCTPEKYADKKGHDYLDTLLNEILENLDNSDIRLQHFIETIQELNDDIYLDRLNQIDKAEEQIPEVTERLSNYIDDDFLTSIC